MAYKNKNKQKAHIANLKNKGWRIDSAEQCALNRQIDHLRKCGYTNSEIDTIMNFKKLKTTK